MQMIAVEENMHDMRQSDVRGQGGLLVLTPAVPELYGQAQTGMGIDKI